MDTMETVFKALGDQNRLRIMKMLEVRPLCNCEIHEILKLAPSTVSKHLGLLKNAGLILDERQGKWVIYRLASRERHSLVTELLSVLAEWGEENEQVKIDQKAAKQSKRDCR